MYVPRRYEEKDREKIYSFIRENGFAILVSIRDGLPIATHIPLQLGTDAEGHDVLSGHISVGNEQKYSFVDGARVLAIFPGPHAYISPRWYTQPNVPTWNYISVHVYGIVEIIEGDELKAALSSLVDQYESDKPHPLKIEDIPEKMLEDNIRGIVGFQISIDDIQAAYKLSQNRDEQSYHQVIGHLQQGDEVSGLVAAEMQRRSSGLFKKEEDGEKG
ncbi:MAG: FMN-binding negative transcriptional regulator [Puia sp.]|nr:FMN-binding negative transcriptional regulator [Puia sp.]